MKKYGICSNPECSAYAGKTDLESIMNWYSLRHLRVAAGGFCSNDPLPTQLVFFADVTFGSQQCKKCGLALIVGSMTPVSLGSCCGCKREFRRSDLGGAFCSKCGAPIDLTVERLQEFHRVERLRALLGWIETLQKAGHIA